MQLALPALGAIGIFDVLWPRDPALAAWLQARLPAPPHPCAGGN